MGDVLIAGAGPTGLTLAITLCQLGIKPRIIDKAAQSSTVSKALAVWSGSLEVLQGMGVIDRFLAAGTRLNALSAGTGTRELMSLKIGTGIDSPYPFPLLLPQSGTEKILGERLAALGVTIERSVELTGLKQDAGGVTATLRHADGRSEEAHCRYLVGCDGARSVVRHELDIAYEGYTEPDTYVLGDVRIDGPTLDRRNIYINLRGGGAVALFPYEDDTWRIFAKRGPVPAGADEPAALEELQRHMDRHGPPGAKLRDPRWLSTFRVNERLAARYRVGNCFLAGDAAHIHSPAGGQGMNTGIQDAVNLGWKLAYVLQGAGDAAILLDSYEAERRPVARHVIKGSADRLHVAFNDSRLFQAVRNTVVSLIGNLSAIQRKIQTELSETEIVYRDGPLVALGSPPARPRRTEVGARAYDATLIDPETGRERPLWPLLCGFRHTLLLFGDDSGGGAAALPARAGDRLAVLRIDRRADPHGAVARRYRLTGPGWVLVRPDQVIAARGQGTGTGGLDRYLDRVVLRAHG